MNPYPDNTDSIHLSECDENIEIDNINLIIKETPEMSGPTNANGIDEVIEIHSYKTISDLELSLQDANNTLTNVNPWFSCSPGNINPEFLNKCNEVIEIQPYNTIFDLESSLKDANNKLIPKSYTNEYNCLNPRFSDNSDLIDN